MAITRDKLMSYLSELLVPDQFKDYAPNGLQVEGRGTIDKIVTGVTACQDLLDAAVAAKAGVVLVHHGFFWLNEDPRVIGPKKKRINTLLANDINLLAYHLPLDVHPVYGNNAQLAHVLGLKVNTCMATAGTRGLVCLGQLPEPMTGNDFAAYIGKRLGREPLYVAANKDAVISTIAWCSGAAQEFIHEAIDQRVDAYLTGEVSEHTLHLAKESGIHLYVAGHHATERYGVKALGEHLAVKFGLLHEFIDIDSPL